MAHTEQLKAVLALSLIRGVGPVLARQIIRHYQDASVIFSRTEAELKAIPNVGDAVAHNIVHAKTLAIAEQELERLEKHNITPLLYDSNDYPPLLRNLTQAPLILFFRGKTEQLAHMGKRTISIVGTRKATPYGREMVQKLVAGLKNYDPTITIVSGLAHGIDAEAHKAALKNNLPSVGVLGHGLSYLYPANHVRLAEDLQTTGGLLTEYPYDTSPDAYNFLQRNRIIAGLAAATIVVESGEQGGALSTAKYCLEYNRHLFAVPGTVGRTMSQGCNRLIARHEASLIESAEDIATMLKWGKPQKETIAATHTLFLPSEDEARILAIIGDEEPKSFDEIVIEAQIPINQLQNILFQLEFAGQIRQIPGRLYEKTH